MLGVAVGTREIKVSLVDFAFQSVPRRKLRALELGSLLDHDLLHTQNELENSETENYLCLNSSQDLETLAETLNEILLAFLQVAQKPGYLLLELALLFPAQLIPNNEKSVHALIFPASTKRTG